MKAEGMSGSSAQFSLIRIALLVCSVAALLLLYTPDVGLGFVKDDVVWVDVSRFDGRQGVANLFVARTGFFRPVVAASFASDYGLWRLDARGYGFTNLGLLVSCAAALALTCRRVGASSVAATVAALAWAANHHGINMATLWLSGRTALWLSLWWTLSVLAFVRQRRWWSVAAAAFAMGSKEEAMALPLLLTAIAWHTSAGNPSRIAVIARRAWPVWLTAIVMLGMRSASGAMTPATAPAHYAYTFSPAALAMNVVEYADRSLVALGIVAGVLWLALRWRPDRVSQAAVPALPVDARIADSAAAATTTFVDRDRLVIGLLWIVVGFLPTFALPVRSSLYAVMPSMGAALALSVVVDRLFAARPDRRVNAALALLVILQCATVPLMRTRNARYANEARLSAAVLREVRVLDERGIRGVVILHDARDRRPTAEQAFGTLADEAARLVSHGRISLWIDPPPAADDDRPRPASPIVAEWRIEGGHLQQ